MRLRAPSYPLITIDPYFSIWSPADKPTEIDTTHWTGKPITLSVIANIDGKDFRLIGKYGSEAIPAANLESVDCSAFSTTYVYNENGVKLSLIFTSPVIPDDLYMLSRPISYLEVKKESADGGRHSVSLKIEMSEEVCMNLRGLRMLEEQEECVGFDQYAFVALVDRVVVGQDRELEYVFRNGMKYEYVAAD